MSEPTQISVSMIHAMLLFAATNEYNPNTVAAYQRLKTARQDPEMDAYADDLAEEMAQVNFPTGTTEGAFGWAYVDRGWFIDEYGSDARHDTFCEMVQLLEDADAGLLVQDDPLHVAMVLRALAISNSMEATPLPPTVVVAHNEPEPDGGALAPNGYWIRLIRGGGKFAYGSMIGSGHWFAYTDDNPADAFDPVKAVWRWFLVRQAEAVQYLARLAEEPDSDTGATDPDMPST